MRIPNIRLTELGVCGIAGATAWAFKNNSLETAKETAKNHIPKHLQKPLSSVIPAVVSTAIVYPFMRGLTLVQKTPQSTLSAFNVITENRQKMGNLFKGATPVVIAGVPQRILPFIVYTETKDFLEPHIANDLGRNLFASVTASLTDSFWGSFGEISSIKKQDNASIKYTDFYQNAGMRRAMGLIVSRDLISNVFGYFVPKELRQQCGMGESRSERIATTFVSSGFSNILTTPLDFMKRTSLSNPDMRLTDIFKCLLKAKGLPQQYMFRLMMVSGRFTMFLNSSEEFHERTFGSPPKQQVEK